MHLRKSRLLTIAMAVAGALWLPSVATAQATTQGWVTGFEPTGSPSEVTNPNGYMSGSLLFQDGWEAGGNYARIRTAEEISEELTAAGLNPANPVRSGTQALMLTKIDTNVEPSGYFLRNVFSNPNVLQTATKVTVEMWARPLAGGLGADPSGAPSGNGTTIGEREGNVFFGIAGDNDNGSGANAQRAAAIRFGVDVVAPNAPLYGNITGRHIDFASATAGSAVWVNSGISWEPDQWYNIRMDLDFTSKTYDVYINQQKANSSPITFYHTDATSAQRFFISKGTNQAGAILDDISVTPFVAPPTLAGDFDLNGFVDGADFLVWQRDMNVGSLDDWKNNYGSGTPPTSVAAVPEPAATTLALVAALTSLKAARKSRRS